MIKVGICGGIGSGKSTVCAMFAERGVAVYDSDTRAKALMSESAELAAELRREFGGGIFTDNGAIDRPKLAGMVFGNAERLARLNTIVHPAVLRDFEQWAESQGGDYVIIESAILFEAGIDRIVDATVAVLAPESLRLQRAMERDGMTAEQIRARMAAQLSDEQMLSRADLSIVNIHREDVEKDVAELDFRFRTLSRKKESDNV